ncbi:MAG: transcriptional regulator with GAF, ATPase, and Fis domain [Planctomycetota bacterium]|jgi:transcriptional regulator with GAF, ATPase, and Fis domain
MTDDALHGFESQLNQLASEARTSGVLHKLASSFDRLASEARDAAPPRPKLEVPMRYGMIGDSDAMLPVFDLIERVAPSNVSVLIQGETGTGKELVAKALHAHSKRADKAFMAENCAAVPAGLLESELFGHTKGSFTGAVKDRAGHFVAADGGTVFLDEIGDMPLDMQAKLLRVLQDGEIRPVGSNKSRRVDVRLVAATHRDLPTACKSGQFREDLYFRLNVITIYLPPLRDRKGDVEHLVRWFADSIEKEMGRPIEFEDEAVALLSRWRWPGNVRELENEVRRAGALSTGRVGVDDLSERILAES